MKNILLESEEVIEEVLQYTTDDVYFMLSECSEKLSDVNENLEMLLQVCQAQQQLLQNSYIDSLAALLLVLVLFQVIKLVRGWTKGVILGGRNR